MHGHMRRLLHCRYTIGSGIMCIALNVMVHINSLCYRYFMDDHVSERMRSRIGVLCPPRNVHSRSRYKFGKVLFSICGIMKFPFSLNFPAADLQQIRIANGYTTVIGIHATVSSFQVS